MTLAPDEPTGPSEAFMIDREFAHLHPPPDHSFHAMPPADVAQAAIDVDAGKCEALAKHVKAEIDRIIANSKAYVP